MLTLTWRLFARQLFILTTTLLTGTLVMFAGPTSGGGINAQDTWVTMNISIQATMSANLPNSVWSVSAGKFVTTTQFSPSVRHYYVEAGFDTSNLLVINIEPTDAPTDPTTTLYDGVGKISVRGTRVFLYDTSNNPIPVVPPSNAQVLGVLPFLGLSPGPSVLKGIITTSPPTMATVIPGTLSYPKSNLAQIVSTSKIGSSSSKTLSYLQSGSNWILQTANLTMTTSSHSVSHVVQVSNVAWNDNANGDALRAAKGSTATNYRSPGTQTLSASAPSTSSVTPSNQVTTGPSGANIVFQHGLASSGSTWNRMVPWMQADFYLANVQTPNLNWGDHLANQASSLTGLVQSSGISNNIVVGHSQGGLIARNVAQDNSSLFKGVVEMDSPNEGALILNNGEAAIGNALVDLFDNLLADAGCPDDTDPACFVAYFMGSALIPAAVTYGLDTAIPATEDLQIGSSYLNNLNAIKENFPRVGISGHSNKRWVEFALAGDGLYPLTGCYPESSCGGRAFAGFADLTYNTFLGLEAYFLLFCDPNQYDCYDDALWAASVLNDMDTIDQFWNDLTAGSDSSDGIVQGASQTYPNATYNYVISGADTHVGATRSPLDRTALDAVLANQFLVPSKACSFSITGNLNYPTSAPPWPFYGGYAAPDIFLSKSSPSTCLWAGSSNVTWVQPMIAGVTDNSPGSYSGNFANFVVEMNLGQDTRTGTFTVAGQNVTVTQSGVTGTVGVGSIALTWTGAPYPPHGGGRGPLPCESITITVNGVTDGYCMGNVAGEPSAWITSIAWQLANFINMDSKSPVNAGVIGSNVYLVSKATTGANYSYSVQTVWSNCPDCAANQALQVTAATAGSTLVGSQ